MEPDDKIKKYIDEQLNGTIRSLPNLRWASVEVTYEDTKAAEHRYVVEVNIAADGTQIRAEDRGTDALPAIDQVNDLLRRRIRDWKGHVYFDKRQEVAAYKDTMEMERTRLLPEDKTGLIVRVKGHEVKPMFAEDAVEQMELLGHDFFLFENAETNRYSVVYRRKAGGYGLIEPTAPVS
jgi:ribosomal subunit interface protein